MVNLTSDTSTVNVFFFLLQVSLTKLIYSFARNTTLRSRCHNPHAVNKTWHTPMVYGWNDNMLRNRVRRGFSHVGLELGDEAVMFTPPVITLFTSVKTNKMTRTRVAHIGLLCIELASPDCCCTARRLVSKKNNACYICPSTLSSLPWCNNTMTS